MWSAEVAFLDPLLALRSSVVAIDEWRCRSLRLQRYDDRCWRTRFGNCVSDCAWAFTTARPPEYHRRHSQRRWNVNSAAEMPVASIAMRPPSPYMTQKRR